MNNLQAVPDDKDDETKKASPAPVEVKIEVSTRRVRRCTRRGFIVECLVSKARNDEDLFGLR